MKLKIYSSREIYLRNENKVREFFSRIHWQPERFEDWMNHEAAHFKEAVKRGYSPKYVVTFKKIIGRKYCNIEVEVENMSREDYEAIACAPGIDMSESDEGRIRAGYFQRRLNSGVMNLKC